MSYIERLFNALTTSDEKKGSQLLNDTLNDISNSVMDFAHTFPQSDWVLLVPAMEMVCQALRVTFDEKETALADMIAESSGFIMINQTELRKQMND